ncbi:MAG TPA: hypothetical protein PKJ08_01010 [Candidatus Cloacimonadota bacterium]|nr:hypothetical protein [Candidatus Cloacimonadota bacterium]
MKKYGWLILIWLFFLSLGGDNFLIPLRIQAAMFSKIASHDGVLKNKDRIRLLIVFDKSTEQLMKDCKKAFAPAFYQVGESTLDKLSSVINEYDIIYFMPKLASHATVCRKYNKLSVACVTMAVVNGDVTIGLGVVQDLPRLYVNISNLEREGHSLSPNILQIAKVYK